MLKTKLLSIFVAFALMVTVGGVYAAWNYTNDEQVIESKNFNATIAIDEASVNGVPGVLSVNDTGLPSYKVENDGDYHTILESNGSITVTYTPNEGTAIQTVNLKCDIVLTNHRLNGTTNIFNLTGGAQDPDNVIEIEKTLTASNIGGATTWTISTSDIGLVLTDSFLLDTYAEWNAFNTALTSCTLSFIISVVD